MSRFLTLVACLVLCTPVAAWADGLSATVDRTELSVEEQVLLSVTVEGSQSAQPTLPNLSAFDVRSRGRSTQVQIINGHMSTAATYSYILSPRRAGNITIGAVTVTIDGKSYKSEPFAVTITAAQTEGSSQRSGSNLFITSELSSKQAYVGQQVVYTWRFFRRVRVGNASVSLPDMDGFLSESLGDQREYDTTLHGQAFHVTEIRKALFPQEPGVHKLPAASLQCEVFVQDNRGGRGDDPFGGPFEEFFGRGQRQTRTLRADAIELRVLPLPQAPPSYTGLVGEYKIEAALSQNNLKVGESTTLTITVSGSGSVAHMGDPEFPSLQDFKVYDDKPVTQVNTHGALLTGSKIFRKALVPTTDGDLVVPSVTLTTFDPTAQAYRVTKTEPFIVHVAPGTAPPVSPGAGIDFAPPSKVDVQVLGDDIIPIYTRLDALYTQRIGMRQAVLWALLFACPPLAFLIFAWTLRNRGRADAQSLRRRRGAMRHGLRVVNEIEQLLKKGHIADAAALASRGMRAYLGAKLGVEGLALTAADVKERLEASGTGPDLAAEVAAWLGRCELAQYSAAPGTMTLYTNLATEMKALLRRLEKKLR